LGVVVVGGLMFSLVLTLFVIPAMYLFLSGKKRSAAPWSKDGGEADSGKKIEG